MSEGLVSWGIAKYIELSQNDKVKTYVAAKEEHKLVPQLAEMLKIMVFASVPDTLDERYAEEHGLVMRIAAQARTIWNIVHDETNLLPRSPGITPIYDYVSALIIFRTVIEAYLNWMHVFWLHKSNDEFTFRYTFWLYEGLVEMIKRMEKYPMPFEQYEYITKLLNEAGIDNVPYLHSLVEATNERERLKDIISKSPIFLAYDKKVQEGILKGNKYPGMRREDLIRDTGASVATLSLMYAHFSGYAHADGDTTREFNRIEKWEIDINRILPVMDELLLMLVTLIQFYAFTSKNATRVLQEHPELKEFCEKKVQIRIEDD